NNTSVYNRRPIQWMNRQTTIIATQFTAVNRNAFPGVIRPAGISRTAVRGFSASMSRSKYRLNAIAAFLAVTIQMSISRNSVQSKDNSVVCKARKNPMIANGSAKTLCANSTNDMYFFISIREVGTYRLFLEWYAEYHRIRIVFLMR